MGFSFWIKQVIMKCVAQKSLLAIVFLFSSQFLFAQGITITGTIQSDNLSVTGTIQGGIASIPIGLHRLAPDSLWAHAARLQPQTAKMRGRQKR